MTCVRYILCVCLGLIYSSWVHAISDFAEQQIKRALIQQNIDITIDVIKTTKIPGIYQLHSGADIFYISEDARYLLVGNVYDLHQAKNTWDLTETSRRDLRLKLLSAIPESDMIVFSPKEQRQASVLVFTDVDCGFSRKLHADIEQLNALGIELRYIAYPHITKDQQTFNKTVSIWCAHDRNQQITTAQLGQTIPSLTCSNPVEQQIKIGKSLGIHGTPTLIFEDGTLVASYLPPVQLAKLANEHAMPMNTIRR